MQGPVIRRGHQALGLVLLLLAQPALAVSLGGIEVRSALGEPLDARIPFSLRDSEAVDASCFTLSRGDGAGDLSALTEGTLTVDTRSEPPVLRVRSAARLFEPAFTLRIRVACSGDAQSVERQYVLLLDPRPGMAGVEALPVVGATVNARPGDSLRSLAATVFPNERAARARYLAAIREMNPPLAATPAGEALPEGTAVTLPDLREFASRPKKRDAQRTASAPQAAPKAQRASREAPDAGTELAAPKPPAPPKVAAPSKAAPPAKPAVARAPASTADIPAVKEAPATKAPRAAPAAGAAPSSSPAFVLRLSSSEVDMSRTRGIDDRRRQQLRERQLVLDADDQVAALLALRNNMKQLETRVADLQLKLAQMPASLAARSEPAAAAPPPGKAPTPLPPKAEPPRPLPPAIATSRIEPAKAAEPPPPRMAEAPKIEPAKVEPPKAEPPRAPIESPQALAPVPPPPIVAPVQKAPPPVVVPVPNAPPPPVVVPVEKTAPPANDAAGFDWAVLAANPWLWAAILALAALVLGIVAWRRRANANAEFDYAESGEATMVAEPAFDEEEKLIPPRDMRTDRPAMASDAGLSTRFSENSRELRRRYIEERFPEIANRTLSLENPASIVKGARLFYEDGALPRAVELLQFAIEDKPSEVRTWLALFEIFRLERLTGEFAALAQRFHQQHGNTEYWRKVQYFGREIDPTNPLYKEDAINTLETIGPREAKRLAAGGGVDPIAENWLEAPMDFENEVLANELRQSLMTVAGLTEQDLIPNPMPALRNVEMFTVA